MRDVPETFNLADYFLFDRLGERLGENVALRFGDRSQTYAEVARDTEALAAHLMGAGVQREQRVLIVLPDTPAFAWAIFATKLLRVTTRAAGAACSNGNTPLVNTKWPK